MLEHVTHHRLELRRELVAAVGERCAFVGGGDGGEDLRNDGGGVVGAQLDLGHAMILLNAAP